MGVRPQQSGNKMDGLPNPLISGSDKGFTIDNKVEDLRDRTDNTIRESLHPTGEFKMPYGRQDQRPSSPKDGDLFFNLSTGQLEMYANTTVTYTGTDAIITDAAPRTVSSALSTFLTRVHAGASVDFYFDADGTGNAVVLSAVVSDTELTLASDYPDTANRDGVAHAFTVRLQQSAQWVVVMKLFAGGAIDGIVTGTATGHSARAFLSAAVQSIPHNTLTKVQYDGEDWDLDSEFDSTTDFRFTPTKAGKYQVNAAAEFLANAVGQRTISIYKNGSLHTLGQAIDATALRPTVIMASDILDMDGISDYIEIFVLQTRGSALDITNTSQGNFISIAKIESS